MSLNKSSICLFFIFTCILVHFFITFVSAISFNITHFYPGAGNINYYGVAKPLNGSIELIRNDTYRVGSATFAKPVRVWDSSTMKLADFTTHFSFTLSFVGRHYGHGIAFFIGPVKYEVIPNSGGGFLGLFNDTRFTSKSKIVMVEFDTFNDKEWDPPMQHIGINNNSISSSKYISWDAGLCNGKEIDVWVAYNATSKNLSVNWSYEQNTTFTNSSWISYQIDLREAVAELATIGFAASTGHLKEMSTIHMWEFSSNLDSQETEEKKYGIVIASASVLFISVIVVVFLLVKMKVLKLTKCGNIASTIQEIERGTLPMKFSYQELVRATNKFADSQKLGRGGSGQVYKGILSDSGRVVAVKRIEAKQERAEKFFTNEVKIISRLIHRNLVQFVGWCNEKDKFLLVYEFMPNGSLDDHLFGNNIPLLWEVRYNIAIGLASALHYLHEHSEQCVVHRDIKPANVLLDAEFCTKLGDFGISKLVDPNMRTQTTHVVGTLGYLAPEYLNTGKASKEADIFSFGVVALEIACGRRTFWNGDYHMALTDWVWKLYQSGNLLQAADGQLDTVFDENQMKCLMVVGLWCTHRISKKRPSAGQVVQVLKFEAPLPELPEKVNGLPNQLYGSFTIQNALIFQCKSH